MNLVRLMGGTIWVGSEVDVGSNFYFTLPLEQGSIDLPKTIEYSSAKDDLERPILDLKILLAEDNLINQTLVKRILEAEGCFVVVVSSGMEVLSTLSQRGDLDIVLMDIQMSEMDGLRTTRIIRGAESLPGISIINPYIPIVALTANAFKQDRDRCIATGMDDYITKPFKIKNLLSVITKNVYNNEKK